MKKTPFEKKTYQENLQHVVGKLTSVDSHQQGLTI